MKRGLKLRREKRVVNIALAPRLAPYLPKSFPCCVCCRDWQPARCPLAPHSTPCDRCQTEQAS